MQITVVSTPSAEAGNACYPANRPPLRAGSLIKLPLGAVRLRIGCFPVIGDTPDAQKWK
jgi:hypothetical protein